VHVPTEQLRRGAASSGTNALYLIPPDRLSWLLPTSRLRRGR